MTNIATLSKCYFFTNHNEKRINLHGLDSNVKLRNVAQTFYTENSQKQGNVAKLNCFIKSQIGSLCIMKETVKTP